MNPFFPVAAAVVSLGTGNSQIVHEKWIINFFLTRQFLLLQENWLIFLQRQLYYSRSVQFSVFHRGMALA